MGIVRALLAIAVLLNHANGIFGYTMMNAVWAVQLFYIVSGFLIAHILAGRYEHTSHGLWLFYSNRLIRIFSTYWVVLVVTLAVAFAGTNVGIGAWLQYGNLADWPARLFFIFTNIFIVGQDLALWLVLDHGSLKFSYDALTTIPVVAGFNVITPAWTIAVELMFYAVAPFFARARLPTLLAWIGASLALRFVLYKNGYDNSQLVYRFFPLELALFLMGMVANRLYRASPPQTPVAVYGFTLIVIAAILHGFGGRIWVNFALFALALPLLFEFSRRVNFDRFVGELSYPIYLIHWPMGQLVSQIGFSDLNVRATVSLVATLILSVALVKLVVQPVDRYRAARLTGSERAHSKATAASYSP
jgi:peptidoglycan/LPS O-acetylase OafA/YrhL